MLKTLAVVLVTACNSAGSNGVLPDASADARTDGSTQDAPTSLALGWGAQEVLGPSCSSPTLSVLTADVSRRDLTVESGSR